MAEYYVSAAGDDSNDGTFAHPWKSCTRANALLAHPELGNSVYFRRGDTFPGRLNVPPGLDASAAGWLTLGAYGDDDARPIISGYKNLNIGSGWVQYDADTWSLEYSQANAGITYTGYDSAGILPLFGQDPSHLVIDGVIHGRKFMAIEDLTEQWDFCSILDGTTLYVRSSARPTLLAGDIKCCVDGEGVRITAATKVTGLHFNGHGAIGISVKDNGNRCLIQRNEVSNIGGSTYRSLTDPTRYGNGIQVWTNSQDCTVEYNEIHDIYDTAWTIQGGSSGVDTHQQDILYRRNLTYRASQAEEYWYEGTGAGFVNCVSEYNTNLFSGYGWGADVRPDQDVRVAQLAYHLGWNAGPVYYPDVFTPPVMRRNIYYDAYGAFSYVSAPPHSPMSEYNVVAMRPGTPLRGTFSGVGVEAIEDARAWAIANARDEKSLFKILPPSSNADISDAGVTAAIAELDGLALMGQFAGGNRVLPIHAPWRAA